VGIKFSGFVKKIETQIFFWIGLSPDNKQKIRYLAKSLKVDYFNKTINILKDLNGWEAKLAHVSIIHLRYLSSNLGMNIKYLLILFVSQFD
jgi:hypothetical protein